jgi:RNA polymerase sigma factor (sigma-70 family)
MATSTLNPVIAHLRKTVLGKEGAGLTDGQLLESFVRQRDEAAFEALVRRHGPMVLGVCRRVLRNHHDAEDAFQATFLVLVRKAGSVVPLEMVANWLYGVAYRTALKARGMIAKQRVRERQVTDMPEPEAVEPDHCWSDLQPLLDGELSLLPDKYRVPVVLCDLEGKTGKEAARQLGWPEGTVASRLSRGRAVLAKQLTRHGLGLSGSSLAVALSQNAASASVPTSLVSSTVKAASGLAAGQALTTGLISAKVAVLTEGVVTAMFLNKVKIAVLVLGLVGVVGAGLGSVAFRAAANDKPAVQNGPRQVAPANGKPSRPVQPAPDNVRKARPRRLDKGKGEKDTPDLNAEAFLKAFQLSSEIAQALGKKTPGAKKQREPDQAKQVLDMVLKGFRAYQESKGTTKDKNSQPRGQERLDLYGEAFLKAFQVSSEMARAMVKGGAKKRQVNQETLDAFGATFVEAYQRAKALKKALEKRKASDGKRGAKTLEALDLCLKSGKQFEQAVKQRAKNQAVELAQRAIEGALAQVERTAHDKQNELETLEEIERLIKDIKKRFRDTKAVK